MVWDICKTTQLLLDQFTYSNYSTNKTVLNTEAPLNAKTLDKCLLGENVLKHHIKNQVMFFMLFLFVYTLFNLLL